MGVKVYAWLSETVCWLKVPDLLRTPGWLKVGPLRYELCMLKIEKKHPENEQIGRFRGKPFFLKRTKMACLILLSNGAKEVLHNLKPSLSLICTRLRHQ